MEGHRKVIRTGSNNELDLRVSSKVPGIAQNNAELEFRKRRIISLLAPSSLKNIPNWDM